MGFVSGTGDDPGSSGGEFHERITEVQDDGVVPVARLQIVAPCWLHGQDTGRRHERVAETRVAYADEVSAHGDDRPGDAVARKGANDDRPPALGQIAESTAEGGLLGRGFLELALSEVSPSRFVDLAIGDHRCSAASGSSSMR